MRTWVKEEVLFEVFVLPGLALKRLEGIDDTLRRKFIFRASRQAGLEVPDLFYTGTDDLGVLDFLGRSRLL